MGNSHGRSISGIESSFLMNFEMDGGTGLDPGDRRSRLKASLAEEGTEGGESPPPGAAMGRLRRSNTNTAAARARLGRGSSSKKKKKN